MERVFYFITHVLIRKYTHRFLSFTMFTFSFFPSFEVMYVEKTIRT
jgi:hypothetical protein